MSIREDKKLNCGPGSKQCGNACIPKSHKCRASWNKPVKAAAAVAGAAGLGLVGTAFLHKREGMRSAARSVIEPVAQAGFAAGNLARGNKAGAMNNVANVIATSKGAGKNLQYVAKGYGRDLQFALELGKNRYFKMRHHKQAKGGRVPGLNYDAEDRTDKKCGASGIPDNRRCTKGSLGSTVAKAAAVAGGVALGGALLNKGSRRAILSSPGAARRAGNKALVSVAEAIATNKKKMNFSGEALSNMRPPSKTQRLAETARRANVSAEQAIKKAANAEVNRAMAVGEAMFKAGKATRASLNSGMRTHNLSVERLRRKYEPGYRRRRDLGSFYKKDITQNTTYVRDRLSKIMDSYKKRKY